MSLLSYNSLVSLVDAGVITADKNNINGASIDITLDNIIRVETDTENDVINLANKENLIMQHVVFDNDDLIYLKPGDFILASSKEYFNLPNNLAAEYKLKSSLARNGLQHLLAGWCDPGWSNSKLTLEFKNVSKSTLVLKPGMKIGQMIFWYCENVPLDKDYSVRGQYNNQHEATGSKGVR